jgi:leader peptidase (prepilin peptidase)/N-methyltransferase
MVGWPVHAVMMLGLFAIGTVVGSFLNVCIYRIPWEKSVIWPASHCPRCLHPIAPQDNIPVLSWVALRGECRQCGAPISVRYPLIELLVGLLFAAVYLTDVVYASKIPWGVLPTWVTLRVAYHTCLVALLVAATFTDYDLTIIPDEFTYTGMAVGIGLGVLFPEIRLEPSSATTHWDGLLVGLTGWLVGGGLTWAVRAVGSLALRREAMGSGDVTLMAMIGSFLGWQAAVLTFFIGPFFGLAHALYKGLTWLGKKLRRQKTSIADREMPLGPYLSMAALTMLLSWPWLWPGWAAGQFAIMGSLVQLLGSVVGL